MTHKKLQGTQSEPRLASCPAADLSTVRALAAVVNQRSCGLFCRPWCVTTILKTFHVDGGSPWFNFAVVQAYTLTTVKDDLH